MKPNEKFAVGFFLYGLNYNEWIEAGRPGYRTPAATAAVLHFRWGSWHVVGVNDDEPHDAEHCTYCETKKGGTE